MRKTLLLLERLYVLSIALCLLFMLAIPAHAGNVFNTLDQPPTIMLPNGTQAAPASAFAACPGCGMWYDPVGPYLKFSLNGSLAGYVSNTSAAGFGFNTITPGSLSATTVFGAGNTVTNTSAYVFGRNNSATATATGQTLDVIVVGFANTNQNGWDYGVYGTSNTYTGPVNPSVIQINGTTIGSSNNINTSGSLGAGTLSVHGDSNVLTWNLNNNGIWVGGSNLVSANLPASFATSNHSLVGNQYNTYLVYTDWNSDTGRVTTSAPNGIISTGTLPTIGAAACGTSGTVVGNNHAMMVTVGSGGTATSCAATFAGAAFTNPPICIAQSNTDRVAFTIASTTTTVTVTAAAAFTAASKLSIHCEGYL